MTDSDGQRLPTNYQRSRWQEAPADDRKVVAVAVLMLFAQAYYQLLECSLRYPCAEMDLKFNRSYLWVVKHLRELLERHPDLADFPGRFLPPFPDLNPSTIRNVDWDEIIAPDVERFISSIQSYAVEHGLQDPEDDTPAGRFVEMFRPGINAAIATGLDYRKRMELQHHRTREYSTKTNSARRFRETHEDIKRNTDLIPSLVEKVDRTPARVAAMVVDRPKRSPRIAGQVVDEHFTATAHFKNINWQGHTYTLKKNAAIVIESIYLNHTNLGTPAMHQDEIFAQVYGSNKKKWPTQKPRIQSFFRYSDAKRLWGDGFIGHDGKGSYFLAPKKHT